MSSSITRLVLAIKSVETDETLERWQFDIHTEDSPSSKSNPVLPGGAKPAKKKEKTEKEVQGEIREIMKQITSSTTFLPILEEECMSRDTLCHIREKLTDRHFYTTRIHKRLARRRCARYVGRRGPASDRPGQGGAGQITKFQHQRAFPRGGLRSDRV
jgi:hypothetical protein